MQLDISLVHCAHSYLNTRREIPCLRAPMYYSLFVILEILKVSIDEDNDSDNDNDKGTEYLYLFVGQAPIWYLLENN